ncbi:helix-turn-helix domain-containing protein [Nocardiopsis coralliicola]
MLRRAREATGLTASQVGTQLQWSSGKVTKMETTESKRIKPDDLDKLMTLYKIDDAETRAAMHALARDARLRGWWSKYKDVFEDRALPDFEAEASTIRTFESQIIPGLLQTPTYTESLLKGGRLEDRKTLEAKAAARSQRKSVLNPPSPARLRAVIEESALRRPIGGPDTLREQLAYLHYMAQIPTIDIQVIPRSTGSHAGFCAPFAILEFPDPIDRPIVYIDTASNGIFLEDPDEVEAHVSTFGDIQGSALSTAQSADLILDIMKNLESQ